MTRASDGSNPPTERLRPRGRKLVSPEGLLKLLNQRLASYGHCHACHFAGPIRRLEDPEEDGRNWSRFIALVCESETAPGCARLAERILDDAVAEYNLSEPD